MNAGAAANHADGDPGRIERALVRRMLAGDERAMEEFAAGYFPGLYRFVVGRLAGDSELAREIVQTAVCKALDRLAGYRGEAPLVHWLRACCRNEIALHFRRGRRFAARIELRGDDDLEAAAAGPAGPAAAAEAELIRRESAQRVHEALDLLPAHYARALEWKYVERLPVHDIAERLRLSAKAAESLLTRARAAFRERYERAPAGRDRRLAAARDGKVGAA